MTDFINNKTGHIYTVMRTAINCTNVNQGKEYVIYYKQGDIEQLFVREKGEFLDKFTPKKRPSIRL